MAAHLRRPEESSTATERQPVPRLAARSSGSAAAAPGGWHFTTPGPARRRTRREMLRYGELVPAGTN